MRIVPLKEIGSNRPLCEHRIRVAAVPITNAALYARSERKRKDLPVDQCGRRGDYRFDGRVLCRPHAGQEALRVLMEQDDHTGRLPERKGTRA